MSFDFKKALGQALDKALSAAGAGSEKEARRQRTERLVAACRDGQSALARRLVKEGADPDTGALMWAALRESDALARFLIQSGASPDGPRPTLAVTPLMQAARYGAMRPLLALIKAGARLDATLEDVGGPLGIDPVIRSLMDMTDLTPLMWAARSGQAEAARALMSAGADASLKTPGGKDAADLALEHGHADLAGMLRSELQRRELEAQAKPAPAAAAKAPRL